MVCYPRVAIEFCTKCKWNLRAAWYMQELLSTFGGDLGEVALIPSDGGKFRVIVETSSGSMEIWDRREQQGFPDSKELKQLVRDVIAPGRNLGHVDGKTKSGQSDSSSAKESQSQNSGSKCIDCEES